MGTFTNTHVDGLRASLDANPAEGREYHVELCNYGHCIQASVSQMFPLPYGGSEQFRSGSCMDMDNPAIAARVEMIGFDRAFEDFRMLTLAVLPKQADAALAVASHIDKMEQAKGRDLP